MKTTVMTRKLIPIVAISFTIAAAACNRSSPPQQDAAAATEPTAAWVAAFNKGDAAALAALYAENGRSLPPGGSVLAGRSQIESYWREDLGEGGVTTVLTPGDAITQGDLVHVDGTYQVKGKDGTELARGQYQQLWTRAGGGWQVEREMWRIDPAIERQTELAQQLTASWTAAYNAGDAKALLALYSDDSALSTVQDGTITGKPAIEMFWVGDLGAKPTSTLTVTDAYVTGELAHLEGDYKVSDSGKITTGRYIQLWMRDADGWSVHREMWWR